MAESGVRTDHSKHGCKGLRGTDQAGHVGEVAVPQRGDEVVHQPELGRLPVDVGRDEEEARLGAEHRVGRQQVLAGAPLWTQHGGGAGGEDEEEEEEEERADDIHGYCPAATHTEKPQKKSVQVENTQKHLAGD